jgi:hypothetical protein
MLVKCKECKEVGLLQTITPRYHRVRHHYYTNEVGTLTGRHFRIRHFKYHRVSTEWALEQINAERQREEAEYRRIMGIK